MKVCFLLRIQNYNSILRRPKQERKSSGKRARLSPHVLALDGALVGELETVQKAVQEVRAHKLTEELVLLNNRAFASLQQCDDTDVCVLVYK